MLKETFPFEKLSALPSHEVGLAVLGYPIKHSISPQLHTAALKVLAEKETKFSSWNYRKIEVSPADLAVALPRLAQLGFRGLNLTIPHKVEVLPLISSIEETARVMGAVNTLSWENVGWKGFNTDGVGLSRAIKQAFKLKLQDFNILILGAGGAARAAVAQCFFEGCANLAIFNRSVYRANELCMDLKRNGLNKEVRILESLSNAFDASEHPLLIINATSLGLRPNDPAPIDLSIISGNLYIYDMVYNPPETNLLIQANQMGYPCANGLGMLVGQAARSLEIWSGREVSIEAMSRAAKMPVN